MRYFKSENGFTLLELLASVVILVIVLTAFFSFFTQSSLFTKKNEDNLVAMNLAREVLEKVKANSSSYPYDESEPRKCFEDEAENGLYPCLTYSEELTTSGDEIENLLRVKIDIYKKAPDAGGNDQLLANAYGYVRE